MRGTRQLCDENGGADLRRDGHQVAEEGCRDLSQLKNLHRGLHAHIDKQDVQHSTAMKVRDLRIRIRKSFIRRIRTCQTVNAKPTPTKKRKKVSISENTKVNN